MLLKSSITLIDFEAILARSSASTAAAPDSSASATRLAACRQKHREKNGLTKNLARARPAFIFSTSQNAVFYY